MGARTGPSLSFAPTASAGGGVARRIEKCPPDRGSSSFPRELDAREPRLIVVSIRRRSKKGIGSEDTRVESPKTWVVGACCIVQQAVGPGFATERHGVLPATDLRRKTFIRIHSSDGSVCDVYSDRSINGPVVRSLASSCGCPRTARGRSVGQRLPSATSSFLAASSPPSSPGSSTPVAAAADAVVQDQGVVGQRESDRSDREGSGLAIVREHGQPTDGGLVSCFRCRMTGRWIG